MWGPQQMVRGVPRAASSGVPSRRSQHFVCPLKDGGSQNRESELGRHPQTLPAPWQRLRMWAPFSLLRALEWDVWMMEGLQALQRCWDAGGASVCAEGCCLCCSPSA